ncbi:MAG: ATP-binding cassette domain-containing protein [Candidatus Lokiarchaeota archaeon]|nr:ATP-binding cassette domain-containing protein [Candidatus Lokiarchaeota archaeon]
MKALSKLAIRNLSKTFEADDGELVKVLDSISFEIAEGEFVSILGPSGCGKTTLLRIIAGLLRFSKGEILIDGTKVSLGHNRIGFIFQQESLFPWRTVRGNIEFGLELQGITPEKRSKLSDSMLELIGMTEYQDNLPHEISGGQARKTEMARSLITSPDILVADEPLSNLDAQTRNFLQEELLRIRERTNSTVLFVSHNVDETVFLSDRIIIMSNIPAKIIAEYTIDIPKPRDRTSAECLTYRSKILEVLREEREKMLEERPTQKHPASI